MNKRWSFLWPFVIVIALLAVSGIEPVSSATTTTFVTPPVSYASPGQAFTIDIKVVDVTTAQKLYSFYINLSFDPDVLLFTGIAEGDFLAEQPDGTDAWGPRVEQELGWVYFGWSTHGAYEGVDGDGTLASVNFNATALGESHLNITNLHTELIEMKPVGGGHVPEQIPCTLENGYFSNVAGVPPVADFTFSPDKPAINEEITFNASDSYDPDVAGYIVSFEWDFGDGTIEVYVDANFTAIATHSYTTGGDKSVMLTVTDDAGMEDSETKIFSVRFAHDVAVTEVQLSKNAVAPGESVSINATVLNKGTSTETFTVIASYDGETIGQKTVSDLDPDEEETVSFDWDTSGVAEGLYSIRANATGVAGDGNLADNVRFGGDVDVKAAAGLPMEYIIIAVVVIIIIVVGVYAYLRRGRQPST